MSMEMSEYPKTETLFNRDPKTFIVDESKMRLPEFGNVIMFRVTEKIDGTNLRVGWDGKEVSFGGRTDKADMPKNLKEYLEKTFTKEKMAEIFDSEKGDVVLFGEGYGATIQHGGNYRKDVSFRLFDVRIGHWWLEFQNILEIASKLGIKAVPSIGMMTRVQAVNYLKTKPKSLVSAEDGGNVQYEMEGIVAKSEPLMLMRNGRDRVMWKLKIKDFGW
jgi:hypothetical protein